MGILHEGQYAFLIISRSFLLRMRNVSYKSCRENQSTRFMFSNFFQESCLLWDNVEKYCRTSWATDDNMAHAHRMLNTKVYKHTLRICNIYCFSTAPVLAWMHLSVTLHEHRLSCWHLLQIDMICEEWSLCLLQELWMICHHLHQNLLSTATSVPLQTFPHLQMTFPHHLHQSAPVIQNFDGPHTNPIISQNMVHMDPHRR